MMLLRSETNRRGALTAAGLPCGSCGTELPHNSKFCNECGAPVTQVSRSAEYKQVTVLFADVVHSMDIAAAVGSERLREIMAELVLKADQDAASAISTCVHVWLVGAGRDGEQERLALDEGVAIIGSSEIFALQIHQHSETVTL
jgi:hypothetical protein